MGYSAMYLHVKCKIATEDDTEDESPRLLDDWFDDEEEEMPIEWEGDWAVIGHTSGKYIRVTKEQYYEAAARWQKRETDRYKADVEAEDERRQQFEQQQESASVPVIPPPQQPVESRDIVLSIPMSGNGPAPGSSRGGQEFVQPQPTEPESHRVSTTASQTLSPASLKSTLKRRRKLVARLARQLTMPSQQAESASMKPSMSTQEYAKKR